MAKSKKNENCEFKDECGRVCKNLANKEDCDYYTANYIPEDMKDRSLSETLNYVPEIGEYDDLDGETDGKPQIIYVSVTKVHPHPNNPRKDLGDLTELADSIKKSGILQPLLVVPYGVSGNEYKTIAGHRRRAAAKLAGLSEVPCIVTDINEKEQRYIMYVENEQRSALTVTEQAQFVQEMIDFGESIEDISSATGISQSTIRRRAKIAKYDKDKVEKSFNRGATIEDYVKLDKIKDPKLRAEVFESIGTNNFENKLSKAMREEQDKEREKEIKEYLNSFATPINSTNEKRFVTLIMNTSTQYDCESIKYYFIKRGSYYELYRDRTEDEIAENEKFNKEQAKHAKKIAKVNEINERFYELRREFIKGLLVPMGKIEILLDFAFRSMVAREVSCICRVTSLGFNKLLETDWDGKVDEIVDSKDVDIRKALLFTSYLNFNDSLNEGYMDYSKFEYKENKKLDIIYDFLIKMGYELSDEEEAWRKGTLKL